MLLSLTRPTAGFAQVLGMNVATENESPFYGALLLSARKVVVSFAHCIRRSCDSVAAFIHMVRQASGKIFSLLEIPMRQRFAKLSNGNQTKVWLLLALARGADLMILDEPTTALDPIFG